MGTVAGKSYSEAELSSIKMSAAFISIAEAELVADVEIITSRTHRTMSVYRGQVNPITSNTHRKYMILGSTPEDCEKFFRGKLLLLTVDDAPFHCCRDMRPAPKETTAQCLLDLPRLSRAGWQLDELKPATIQVLGPAK